MTQTLLGSKTLKSFKSVPVRLNRSAVLSYWTFPHDRPVKVVRLLARDTVEEIMYSRAVSKLHLTNTVIEEGRFSLLDQAQSAAAGLKVGELTQNQEASSIFCLCLA